MQTWEMHSANFLWAVPWNSAGTLPVGNYGMDNNFLCTYYVTQASWKACTRKLALISTYRTTLTIAEIEECNRIEMRTRNARGNSGIKQLCAFLFWFFTSLPYLRSDLTFWSFRYNSLDYISLVLYDTRLQKKDIRILAFFFDVTFFPCFNM